MNTLLVSLLAGLMMDLSRVVAVIVGVLKGAVSITCMTRMTRMSTKLDAIMVAVALVGCRVVIFAFDLLLLMDSGIICIACHHSRHAMKHDPILASDGGWRLYSYIRD